MFLLIIGGSGSGKSAYAEKRLCALQEDDRIYLATMQPYGKEGKDRIVRHRRLREGKGFRTLECPRDLDGLSFCGREAVLLEDLPNLLANEQFRTDWKEPASPEKILRDLLGLRRRVQHLVIVTGNVFEDGIEYEIETQKWLKALGFLHQKLCAEADETVEVVYGIPLRIR